MKAISHVLGVRHCKRCPCLGGIRDGLVCNFMNKGEGYIGGWYGSEDWECYFPCWCPLLSCNYKKPKKLSLKVIPSSFYYEKKSNQEDK